MSSRRVDVKTGVVDTVNVAEASGRTRVVLNVDNLVPYETRVAGNTIIVSVGGRRGLRTRRQRCRSVDGGCRSQPDDALRSAGLRLA